MMVDRAFCESTEGGVKGNITDRSDKPISTILYVYSNKDRSLLFPKWKRANVINLPLGGRVVPRNGAIIRSQC